MTGEKKIQSGYHERNVIYRIPIAMRKIIPQFLLTAPTSGAGKTTISSLLMLTLRQQGLSVQPYKCGPDYIDTKFHEKMCGKPSYNLDLFMASPNRVRELYARHARTADVCVVEGMMGMFDGYDKEQGSSAMVAKTLNIPVVLIVDAKSSAYSLAALIKGFIEFDKKIHIAGVIFNRVGSERHEQMLRDICSELNITCFGCLRMLKDIEWGNRYLGLDFTMLTRNDKERYDLLCSSFSKQIDCKLLLDSTMQTVPEFTPSTDFPSSEKSMEKAIPYNSDNPKNNARSNKKLHISVARNEESFSFLYAEHIDILQSMGEVTFFDPEDSDASLPVNTDLLYLPGGYPERHAAALVKAKKMMLSVKEYIESGGRTLAECGGLIYLSSTLLIDTDECAYPMVGIFPLTISSRAANRRLSLGYRQFELNGEKLYGHEFHYSQVVNSTPPTSTIVQVYNARNEVVDTPVYRYKNTLASYTHLYWGGIDLLNLFEQ